jgi:hypothetical protein
MATRVIYGKEIGFTILPYPLDTPIQQELLSHPHDDVLGYVTYDKQTDRRKFTYTESGELIETDNHWSLQVLKESPYLEHSGPWIIYKCHPQKVPSAFSSILSKLAQLLYIYDWDIWSVEGKKSKVAVVTAWERY